MLDNVVLPNNKGTSQIDHIVISKYGVFAIETKNYRGDIYGDDNRRQWTQIIVTKVRYARKFYKTYTYVTKNELYNPVKQSLGHIYTIKKHLSQWRHIKYIPIVVFMGKANLRNVYSNYHVVYDNELLETIRNYRTACLSDNEVDEIVNCLSDRNVREQIDDKAHARNVNTAKGEWDRKVATGVCPKCGGKLILRHGRYGNFYGCSNYPRCRFTTSASSP